MFTTNNRLVFIRFIGIAISMVAWVVTMRGFAHLAVAAIENNRGELGLGIDGTKAGAVYCLIAFAIACVGIPLWVFAERQLRILAKNVEVANLTPATATRFFPSNQRGAL